MMWTVSYRGHRKKPANLGWNLVDTAVSPHSPNVIPSKQHTGYSTIWPGVSREPEWHSVTFVHWRVVRSAEWACRTLSRCWREVDLASSPPSSSSSVSSSPPPLASSSPPQSFTLLPLTIKLNLPLNTLRNVLTVPTLYVGAILPISSTEYTHTA